MSNLMLGNNFIFHKLGPFMIYKSDLFEEGCRFSSEIDEEDEKYDLMISFIKLFSSIKQGSYDYELTQSFYELVCEKYMHMFQ